MKKTILFLALASLLFLPSCKKQQTIYEFLTGDWGYPIVNHNGVIAADTTGETDWAIDICYPKENNWCVSHVIYRTSANNGYVMEYKISPNEQWMLVNKSSGVDSFEIMELTKTKFVYRYRAPGVIEVATWYRL